MPDKITINLLPAEIAVQKKAVVKKKIIIRVCIGLLSTTVVISLIVFVFGLFQNLTINKTEQTTSEVKNKITLYKDQEGLVFTLKDRLAEVNRLFKKETYPLQGYTLISSLAPSGVNILNISTDRAGVMKVDGNTISTKLLDDFFNNLTNPANNEGKILSAKIDSLSRKQNGTISFELQITLSPIKS